MIRRLWAHAVWADTLLLEALVTSERATADANAEPQAIAWREYAWREYAHLLGADAVWLARLEGQAVATAVWPTLSREETLALREHVVSGYGAYLARVDDATLSRPVEYTNSAGQSFRNAPYEVLTHVALHAQYHRGKINLLLRQGGTQPAPVDYISFVRGAPAAVTPVSSATPGTR